MKTFYYFSKPTLSPETWVFDGGFLVISFPLSFLIITVISSNIIRNTLLKINNVPTHRFHSSDVKM